MNDIILLKQGEIILKGRNRREFENKLLENIKRRLRPIGEFRVYALQSTVYVEPQGECDMDAALDAMRHIFGALTVTRAAACEKDKDAILQTAAAYLGDALKAAGTYPSKTASTYPSEAASQDPNKAADTDPNAAAKTFKVESKRADKQFPMTSIQLSQYVGGELHDLFPHLKPDMHSPDLLINVEVRDLAAYVHGPAERGAGGLPVGTGGRMVALLSGGIDSPVALYLMAKRGVRLIPVHFYSHPYTSVQAKEKVLALAEILEKYCGSLKVELVSFTQIQEEIRRKTPEPLATVITRRFMMRIAERIAKYHGCDGIVTGDSLGQVASQTTQALVVVERCIDLPVFRPLIAFDKEETIKLAREIGTYETSILPFEDCCTVFTPRRPRTKPKIAEIESAERNLDVEGLIERAQQAAPLQTDGHRPPLRLGGMTPPLHS